MSLLTVGSVAFDALETPYGKTDKILGGAATYITLSASYFTNDNNLVAVVGGDFPQEMIDVFGQHNINTEGLQIIKEGKIARTTSSMVMYRKHTCHVQAGVSY